MKKVFLAIAVVIGLGVNAQNVKFGVKAGLNVANVSNLDGEIKFDSRMAYHVGAMAEAILTERFSVQPEVLFSVQGVRKKEGGITATINLNYVNVPVMAKYYIIEGLSLEVGPQVGFLTTAEFKLEGAGGKSGTEDIKDELKKVDFGLNFGTSYNYQNFNLGVRYNLGLTDLSKEREEGDASKNGVFQISLGYFF